MPLPSGIYSFGVTDAKIQALLSDPEFPGTATYGPLQDIPLIQNFKFSFETETKEADGDDVGGAVSVALVKSASGSFEYGRGSLAINAIALGGSVVSAGVTPNQTLTWKFGESSIPKPFALKFQCTQTDLAGGDIHVYLYKCTGVPKNLGMSGGEFATAALDFSTSIRVSDKVRGEIIYHETAIPIA
jgi:hypothetical protein